jgi:DNA-directed RNA polymerase alpha subunit
MNPKISNVEEEGDLLRFTLSGVNVSLANALRRIILSEIPTLAFITEHHETNQCTIEENTSRLHNEIIRQRLGCIPIHMKDLDVFPGNYIVEVDVSNDTEEVIYATTEHFKIKNKNNDHYLSKEETRKIFPPNPITHQYIDFVRLRPKISDTIPGEKIKLKCEFSVSTAKENSMYNVVSKCSYCNTPDLVKSRQKWEEYESSLSSEVSNEERVFQKRNFELLDAERYFVPESFDFVIQTLGVFENRDILKKGCMILQNKFVDFVNAIDADTVPIVVSETTMENSYDIVLEGEDYTMGKVIEYLLYDMFYVKEKRLSFCGFKKYHPHNTESIIRIAFTQKEDRTSARQCLRTSSVAAADFFKKLFSMF